MRYWWIPTLIVIYLAGLWSGCSLVASPPVDDPRIHEAQVQHQLMLLSERAKTDTAVLSLAYGTVAFTVVVVLVVVGMLGVSVSMRVAQDALPQVAKSLVILREAQARAHVLEHRALSVDEHTPALPTVDDTRPTAPEPELLLSTDNLYVRDVLSKMVAIIGPHSSKLPSAPLRIAKSLSNTYAQPVINALVSGGWVREHLPGEAKGLWVNGHTLGELISMLESGEVDLTGKIGVSHE